jgi:galactose mutarotase-like enzyme
MPFSLGLHPYFNVSRLETVRFEGLPSDMPGSQHHEAGRHGGTGCAAGPGGGSAGATHRNLPPIPAVGLVDPEAGTRLELQLTPPLDLVVIWTDPPRTMVCLEPWSGPRQALISGDRRLELAPGESRRLGCRYGVGPVTAGSTWR